MERDRTRSGCQRPELAKIQAGEIFQGIKVEDLIQMIIQKNEKINILSVPFINLNFPPSSVAKKVSDEWHFDHFTNIF